MTSSVLHGNIQDCNDWTPAWHTAGGDQLGPLQFVQAPGGRETGEAEFGPIVQGRVEIAGLISNEWISTGSHRTPSLARFDAARCVVCLPEAVIGEISLQTGNRRRSREGAKSQKRHALDVPTSGDATGRFQVGRSATHSACDPETGCILLELLHSFVGHMGALHVEQ